MECSIEDCDNQAKYAATGWCQTHYHRYWRNGSTDLRPKHLRTDLSYRGAHARVRMTFGAASKYRCVKCSEWAKEWAYDGVDPDQRIEFVTQGRYRVAYSVWPEFYMPLCFPCHRAFDAGNRAGRRRKCHKGHELTPENCYTAPSKPGSRDCRTCRKVDSATRYQARKAARCLTENGHG